MCLFFYFSFYNIFEMRIGFGGNKDLDSEKNEIKVGEFTIEVVDPKEGQFNLSTEVFSTYNIYRGGNVVGSIFRDRNDRNKINVVLNSKNQFNKIIIETFNNFKEIKNFLERWQSGEEV